MARTRRGKTLGSLEGKLRVIVQREAQKLLGDLKREIARREGELAALKVEYGKGLDFLRGRAKPPAAPKRRRARRRARPTDWKRVFSALPAHFTLDSLRRHPVAGKRPTSHLYAIISRWKKEKLLTPAPAGGYRKLGVQPKKKPAPRPKPAQAPKQAARPEASGG